MRNLNITIGFQPWLGFENQLCRDIHTDRAKVTVMKIPTFHKFWCSEGIPLCCSSPQPGVQDPAAPLRAITGTQDDSITSLVSYSSLGNGVNRIIYQSHNITIFNMFNVQSEG